MTWYLLLKDHINLKKLCDFPLSRALITKFRQNDHEVTPN